MDNSAEMVRVMNEKITSAKAINLRSLFFNLETEDFHGTTFDLIFTQMVLHHVVDIEKIINKFYHLLNPGSWLIIADLYEEDGSFHGEGFSGHNGFNIESLSGILRKYNFSGISHNTCFVIDKKISITETKQFEVFMLKAKRE
jgi:SAM-dependent methyltransferase